MTRTWRLLGPDGPYQHPRPGTYGGHAGTRLYGRLDCPSARRAIARGGYVAHQVFFATEADAIASGYRPCASCLPDRYRAWKARRFVQVASVPSTARVGTRVHETGQPAHDDSRNDPTEARPMANTCTHLDTVRDVTPSGDGCEDCLRIGARWLHLRLCMYCGHVGCCDSSPNRHATAHWREHRDHPLIRSYEPGEDWWWCYADDLFFEVDGAPSAPSHP